MLAILSRLQYVVWRIIHVLQLRVLWQEPDPSKTPQNAIFVHISMDLVYIIYVRVGTLSLLLCGYTYSALEFLWEGGVSINNNRYLGDYLASSK